MRINSCILIFLSFLYTQVFSQALSHQPKEKYQNEAGRFKVAFPSPPEISNKKVNTDLGELVFHVFRLEPETDDNEKYEVSYMDYPEGFADSLSILDIYEVFNASQSSLASSPDIQALGTFDLFLMGYPGREYRWQFTKENYFRRLRFFMVKDRLYLLSVKTAPDNNFNKSINQFFNSFELINTPKKEGAAPLGDKELGNTFFSIEYPGPTESREIQTTTEYGQTKLIFEGYQPNPGDEPNLAYFTALMRYPMDITKTEGFDLESYYENVTANSLKATQSILINSKEIMLEGVKGVETKQNFKEGQIIITTRIFLIRDHQISLQVMSLRGQDGNEKMMKFIDSLKLLKK